MAITDGVGFPIKATDQFSAAFDKLMGKVTEADRAFEKLNQVGGRLGGLLGALGIGAGLAGFTAMIKSAIDSADAIEELSQKTGIAIKELSQWDYVLKREGISQEVFGKSVKELSKNILEAGDASSQSAKLFKAMGVDITSGPDKAMEQLADAFAALPDGATKATLATQVFGKAGMDLIPMLNMGSEGIRQLKGEADRLGLTLTAETAAAAAKFNDDLSTLQAKTRSLGVSIMTELMPSLSDITGAMKTAAEEAGILTSLWVGLGGLGDLVFNGTKIKQARDEVSLLTVQVDSLNEQMLTAGPDMQAGIIKSLDMLNPKLEAAKKNLDLLTGKGEKAQPDAWSFGPDAGVLKQIEARKRLEELIRSQGNAAKSTKKAMEDMDSHVVAWNKLQEKLGNQFKAGEDALKNAIGDLKFQVELIGLSSEKQEELTIFRKLDEEYVKAIKGLNSDQIDQLTEQLGITKERVREQLKLKKEKSDQLDLEELIKKNQADQLAQVTRQNEQLTGSLTDALMRGFENGKGFAENFRDTLKNMFNTLVLRPIIQPIAQAGANFIQNLLGGGGGGGGNFMSTIMSLFSGGGGGSAAGGSVSSQIFGMMPGIGAGSGAGSGGGFLSNIMGMFGGSGGGAAAGATPAGWIALAAAAQYAVGQRLFRGNRAAQQASMFGILPGAIVNWLTGGSKENQNFRLMQGTGAGEGLFGGLGVEGTYGFDLKALRGVTGGLDARILRIMGGDATAGTAALAAYTQAGRRADGQPAQFAFPEGDQTAAEQIAKELLQSRYGTLFGLIDKSFAEQIKSWAGTSTELQAFIESALGLFESLAGTKIKGLNIETLRALSREGEELGDTMNRVAGDFSTLNSMFVDETDAYLQALKFVGDEFAALGVTLPVNADSFKQLRDGLDLSTESGRAMFDMLVRVAPAMQSIEQAAAQMLSSFNSSMGSIFGSSFTRQVIEGQAAGLVSQFQSMTGLFGGMDPMAVFRGIGDANASDIQYLYQTGGPELQSVLNKILALYAQYAGLQETVNTNTQQFGQVTSQVIDRMVDARAGLRGWLDSLFLNDQLSPLSPMQQLEESRRQYESILGQAQGGSADAVAGLGGAAQTYLQIARDLFASSPAFNDIFRSVTTAVGGVAGVSSASINDRLATALPSNGTLATGAQVQSLENTVLVLINLVANGISVQDPASRQAILDLTTAVNRLNAGGLITQS